MMRVVLHVLDLGYETWCLLVGGMMVSKEREQYVMRDWGEVLCRT